MTKEELMQPSDTFCKSCGNPITKGRVKFANNPVECTTCSSTERNGAVQVISGKTTYSEIQIVDQETANNFNKCQQRSGSIVGSAMRGLAKTR